MKKIIISITAIVLFAVGAYLLFYSFGKPQTKEDMIVNKWDFTQFTISDELKSTAGSDDLQKGIAFIEEMKPITFEFFKDGTVEKVQKGIKKQGTYKFIADGKYIEVLTSVGKTLKMQVEKLTADTLIMTEPEEGKGSMIFVSSIKK